MSPFNCSFEFAITDQLRTVFVHKKELSIGGLEPRTYCHISSIRAYHETTSQTKKP